MAVNILIKSSLKKPKFQYKVWQKLQLTFLLLQKVLNTVFNIVLKTFGFQPALKRKKALILKVFQPFQQSFQHF